MKDPVWHSINPTKTAEAKRSSALREGRELAFYLHGPIWGDAHEETVTAYLVQNGHQVS